MAAEFLPLCDVLFNVISLAGYFCDVVFDVVMCYALLERGRTATAATALAIIACSLLISQVVSMRWYLHVADGAGAEGGSKRGACARYAPHVLHCLQLGVLWRYAKLFVPVDLRYVKHEVRNLCMLRLVHAFCEAAPMLLLQLHVLAEGFTGTDPQAVQTTTPSSRPVLTVDRGASAAFTELNIISASLSLFSVCWALASFSKNVRLQNVHRLVLTWLGVIFQFAWRLGTISARVTALTVYASLYEHWVFLVIGLHWVSMFLWLISPKNVFHGERISRPRKAYLSALIAFVYVFAYVNLQEVNHRQKMVTFYLVMLVENCLLVCVWVAGVWGRGGEGGIQGIRLVALPLLVLASFSAGIAFMLLYYRYFHVRRLGYELGGRLPPLASNSTDNKLGLGQYGDGCYDGPAGNGTGPGNGEHQVHSGSKSLYCGGNSGYHPQRNAIPGVFNCRFANPVIIGNAATKRKKKKPTSFVPPPAAPPAPLRAPRPAPLPFWRRPLPAPHNHSHCGSSENEGSSIGSRVNIHQKLQEKKQKQLAELKIIEEEIKQGKLANNAMISGDEIYSSLQRQPIPRTKKHIDLEPLTWAPPSPELGSLGQSFENLNTLGQPNCPQNQKLYDGLTNAGLMASNNQNGHQNNGYENFSGFSQNALAATNLVGQFLGSFPSYTEIPNIGKNSSTISPINIPGNYESVPQCNSNNRNMSPSSQISNGEQNNSLTRQILPRSKNPRQFISSSGQHRQNVYPSDRQISDMQRASEQARLLYGDSSSPRTVLQHQNTSLPTENNSRIQRNYPESGPTPRVSNFSPTVESVARNTSYENGKSVSSRNITNMSPRTVYTDAGSAANSFERTSTNQVNRLIENISPRQMGNSNGSNSGMFNENQSHGRQYSGVYSVTNHESTSPSHGLHLNQNGSIYTESRQESMMGSKQGSEYRDLPNFGNFTSDLTTSKTADSNNGSHNREGSRSIYADGINQRLLPSVYTTANEKSNLSFPYQVVPPPKAKLDRTGGNLNMVEQARKMQRCKTPEILLAPHFLETSRPTCCHWGMPYRGQHDTDCCQQSVHGEALSSGEGEPLDLPCRPPSDIDSQISLPRSYTLPREFKYYRRNRQRRLMRPDHFVASTNSSDGDVDSGDDNESERLSNNSSKSNINKPSNQQGDISGKSPTADSSQKYRQSKTANTSQHQHSVSQPSSSHFNENTSQSENRRQLQNLQDSGKIIPQSGNREQQQLSCQNVSIYGKMAAGNSANSHDDFNSEDFSDDKLDCARLENSNTPDSENSKGVGNSGEFSQKNVNLDVRYNGIYGNGVDRQPFYAGVSPAHGRQLRNRMYGISKLGMIKHETKL